MSIVVCARLQKMKLTAFSVVYVYCCLRKIAKNETDCLPCRICLSLFMLDSFSLDQITSKVSSSVFSCQGFAWIWLKTPWYLPQSWKSIWPSDADHLLSSICLPSLCGSILEAIVKVQRVYLSIINVPYVKFSISYYWFVSFMPDRIRILQQLCPGEKTHHKF